MTTKEERKVRRREKRNEIKKKLLAPVGQPTLIDRFLNRTFLWAIPQRVTPNSVTLFRFATIPFVLFLLIEGAYGIGTVLFAISAFSDAVDGALARTRQKITDWGKLYDPLADKLLIGSAVFILVSKLISYELAFAIIFIELLLILTAYYKVYVKRSRTQVVPQAVLPGKIKMILQCLGILSLLLYITIAPFALMYYLASFFLYVAVIFAIISLIVYRSI